MYRQERYMRQPIEQTVKTHEKKIAIIGVGGVGSNAAQQAAMMGVAEMHLIDYDRIDIHNLNRSVFNEEDVGKPKVEQVAKMVRALNPSIKVLTNAIKITSIREIPDVDVLFSLVDNVHVREIFERWATKNPSKVIIDAGTSEDANTATVVMLKKNRTPRYETLFSKEAWEAMHRYESETPPCDRRSEPAIAPVTTAAASGTMMLFIQYATKGAVYSGLHQFNWGKSLCTTFFPMKPEIWR